MTSKCIRNSCYHWMSAINNNYSCLCEKKYIIRQIIIEIQELEYFQFHTVAYYVDAAQADDINGKTAVGM